MLKTFLLFIALLIGGDALGQSLPNAVPTRIGRAGGFMYNYTNDQYLHKLQNFDWVWSNQPTSGQGGYNLTYTPPGTITSNYMPINRTGVLQTIGNGAGGVTVFPAPCVPTGGCNTAWFQANHPSWIIYKSDQFSPAYQYNSTTYTPLDISNPDVQAWMIANMATPATAYGAKGLSIDNSEPSNLWGEYGVCSVAPLNVVNGCTAAGGTFTQLYNGTRNDPTWTTNRAAWLSVVRTWAHSLGMITTCNISYEGNSFNTQMINACDMTLDEAGFIGSGTTPVPCQPSPSFGAGPYVAGKLAFYTAQNSGAGTNLISLNGICPYDAWYQPGKNSTFDLVEYVTALYLLVKNDYSYLWSTFTDASGVCSASYYCLDKPGANWPQYWLEHGAASGAYAITSSIYNRDFANVLALVNLSTTTAFTYNLGSNVYHRANCMRYTGVVTLPKISGMVLIKGEPTACVVGR